MAVSRCSVRGEEHVFVSEIDLFAECPDNTADRRKALEAFMKAYHPQPWPTTAARRPERHTHGRTNVRTHGRR